jgi:hypothetical protein
MKIYYYRITTDFLEIWYISLVCYVYETDTDCNYRPAINRSSKYHRNMLISFPDSWPWPSCSALCAVLRAKTRDNSWKIKFSVLWFSEKHTVRPKVSIGQHSADILQQTIIMSLHLSVAQSKCTLNTHTYMDTIYIYIYIYIYIIWYPVAARPKVCVCGGLLAGIAG